MKPITIFFIYLTTLLIPINSQFGTLKLDSKPNNQFQLTATNIYSPATTTKMLKRITSLVNTPTFTLENLNPPQYPDNIKYTETDDNDVYIIVLPHMPSYVKKEDIIVENGLAGIKIKVKDSGLYHNDAFFPDLTDETHSSIIRGRDYEQSISYFRKLRTAMKCHLFIKLS